MLEYVQKKMKTEMDLVIVKVCRSCCSNPWTVSRNHTIEVKPHVLMGLKEKLFDKVFLYVPYMFPLGHSHLKCPF